MTWEAAGALGEIIGATAVVITLVYLAIQTKNNAQALDATSSREFAYRLSEWHREVARDPELKRIVLKSISFEPEEYSEPEWFEFRLLAISLFRIYETGFIHLSLKVGNQEESENHIANARSLIDSLPAWSKFWDQEASTGTFTEGFIKAVNSRSPTFDYRTMNRDIQGDA